MMFKSFIQRIALPFQHFGRVDESNELADVWQFPKREKFYISTDELKTVGLALNHYKKHLRKQKEFDKIEKVADLDNRIFQIITMLEESNHVDAGMA